MIIDNIIDSQSTFKIEDKNLYNFLNASRSSRFYEELFSEEFQRNEKPELYNKVKSAEKSQLAYSIMDNIVTYIQAQLNPDAIVIEIGGGVDQQRSSYAYKKFSNYFPLDISYSSIKRYTQTYNKVGLVCDATKLPFKDNSVDCIFTHTFLEHPLDPESVLKEIARVVKPNGLVIHNDAWFCRWWHYYGIVGLKSFKNMSIREKLIYMMAQTTEIKILRYPPIIFHRLLSSVFKNKNKTKLRFKKLTPNYNLHLSCDEDAASAIDPVDVIKFYESRNFVYNFNLSLVQRLIFPNKYIILRKK